MLAALVSGCGTTAPIETGQPDAGASFVPTAQLVIEGPEVRSLATGDSATFVVSYADLDGRPIAGAPVHLALEGRAQDSTLSTLTATTDESGKARATLIAGATAAAFRVRATASGANPQYVSVQVSVAGRTTIAVTASYRGTRTLSRKVIDVFQSVACAALSADMLGARHTETTAEIAEGIWDDLPDNGRLAVRALGLGTGDVVLAEACIDGVDAASHTFVPVSLVLRDLPLDVSGPYDTSLRLDTDASAATVAAAIASSTHTLLTASGGEGNYLLDELERWLDGMGRAESAATVRSARRTRPLGANLAAVLGASASHAETRIDALTDVIDRRLETVSARGTLALAVDTPGAHASFALSAVELGDGSASARVITLDPADPDLALHATVMATRRPTGDELVLAPLSITLGLGTAARVVVSHVVRDASMDSIADYLSQGTCDAFSSWLRGDELGSLCDETCAEAVCKASFEHLWSVADDALETLDARRTRIELTLACTPLDTNADRRAETLRVDSLTGRWTADDAPNEDTLSGVASTSAVAAAPARGR